jgi:hypothetical protein
MRKRVRREKAKKERERETSSILSFSSDLVEKTKNSCNRMGRC